MLVTPVELARAGQLVSGQLKRLSDSASLDQRRGAEDYGQPRAAQSSGVLPL